MTDFARYADKLAANVYGSLKGVIRLELLQRDIAEFLPGFSSSSLTILDVGGGEGHFARLCLDRGHRVVLLDASVEMLRRAEKQLAAHPQAASLELVHADFLHWQGNSPALYDLVALHGSAEWMDDTAAAISKALRLASPKGVVSLLVFNRDKYRFKLGINGLFGRTFEPDGKKLVPPGALGARELRVLVEAEGSRVLLQSGIRIFYGFFRDVQVTAFAPEQWLAQELACYRTEPFSLLGEHSHLLCSPPGRLCQFLTNR